ncbi:hypothetical protein SLEP1_g30086 [Rubroshorea leprosula]|uniref:Uncharacterized protein n=1 Tax=Rubroshorea leprosula TaxID=152421 RepID=A0AAV5K7K9_9ROSI|nr:hypothetical protein SLEP1_g30086 [Rubroshorea leprosula]
MEESVKRKERLKAMRSEAALADVVPNDSETSGHLSNPLIETSSVQEEFRATSRFDYYTDPMAAFSANRKRGKVDGQGRQDHFTPPVPGHFEVIPSPVYQMQNNYSHDHRMYQAQNPYSSTSPLPMHQGTPDAWNGPRAKTNYYNHAHGGSTQGYISPSSVYEGAPRPWYGAGDAGGYNSPSNPHRNSNSPSPCSGLLATPDFSHGQGRSRFGNNSISGSVYRGSPGFSPGRGRGSGYGSSPGTGRGGRQGPGSHHRNFASDRTPRPERFYDESMLEDPWQHLKPIPWKKQDSNMPNPVSSNSWLPKSISMKKEGVSEAFNKSSSGPSLAEYLAASFNKAVEDSLSE